MKNMTYTLEAFNRFELFPNTTNIGLEKAFSIYGILVFPTIIGGLTFHYVFGIKGIIFWITFGIFTIVLLNIYMLYNIATRKDKIIKLIIDTHYIQIIYLNAVQFQANIQDVTVESFRCSKEGYPALKLSSEAFQSIIIGVRQTIPQYHNDNEYPLNQPDYWVSNKREWHKLQQVLQQE